MANPIEELTKRVEVLEKSANAALDFSVLVKAVKVCLEAVLEGAVMGTIRRTREFEIKAAIEDLKDPVTE